MLGALASLNEPTLGLYRSDVAGTRREYVVLPDIVK
jgi:hypothetical protein